MLGVTTRNTKGTKTHEGTRKKILIMVSWVALRPDGHTVVMAAKILNYFVTFVVFRDLRAWW